MDQRDDEDQMQPFSHPHFAAPPDDTVIWRYVDLEKMLAMLHSKCLNLTRLDKLKDPWEGTWPNSTVNQIKTTFPANVADGFLSSLDMPRTTVYVSCWHISNHESASLWEQYSNSAGFALKSTIGLLRTSLSPCDHVFLGSVHYIDYDSVDDLISFDSVLRSSFAKRKSFEHEREVRLIKWLLPEAEEGKPIDFSKNPPVYEIPINLDRLITSVYLSPRSEKWLLPHIRALFGAFGLGHKEIIRSELYDPRVY